MEDTTKNDPPKIPDMVMCGDHPSFTKTDLNMKDTKLEELEKEKEQLKEKIPLAYARLTPTLPRTERPPPPPAPGPPPAPSPPSSSEHALRAFTTRRRRQARLDSHAADTESSQPSAPLLQAALGSFRWPPYLLAVWVLVLVLTHLLHCLVSVLERSLPAVKRLCQSCRSWTQQRWRAESELSQRLCPLALAALTALLYSLYFSLYLLYAVALWAIEPLGTEVEEKRSSADLVEMKVTNYIEEAGSKSNSSIKP